MIKAHLIFTQYKNSYSVKVQNLEQLTVEQIQEIQKFVENRNGFFDFDSYSFTIQKRIEYKDFVAIMNYTEIKSFCEENLIVEQTQPRIGFGQYKGMQYNELPDSYLLWLKANYRGSQSKILDSEIKKRKL